MNLFLHIAGFTVAVRFQKTESPYVKEKLFMRALELYYPGFLLKKTPIKIDFTIIMAYQKNFGVVIDEKTKKYYFLIYEETGKRVAKAYYNISIEQFQVVLRNALQTYLAESHGMLLHASASLVHAEAYVFFGDSGAGKSTTMITLAKKFIPLADDTIILRKHGKSFSFYQTPFHEKNRIMKKSEAYTLGKMFFLRKASKNQVKKFVGESDILYKFLHQFLSEKKDVKQQMKDIASFVNSFHEFYILHANISHTDEMVELIERL